MKCSYIGYFVVYTFGTVVILWPILVDPFIQAGITTMSYINASLGNIR